MFECCTLLDLFFFKQKTAYEMRISYWSSDVCSSDLLRRWSPDRLAETGGFSLWRTDDGVHWEPVTRDGFGNKFNWGGRTFASTPHGLFVGTANPFGPRLAMRRDGEWQYGFNPRGGCEVWLGSKQHHEPADAP